MDAATLAKLVGKANCRVFGWEDAANEPQRSVLAVLIEGFDHKDATILCEPSLARKTTRPPDALLIDPIAGVHLIEVKGRSRSSGGSYAPYESRKVAVPFFTVIASISSPRSSMGPSGWSSLRRLMPNRGPVSTKGSPNRITRTSLFNG